jgi:hypothetical protein
MTRDPLATRRTKPAVISVFMSMALCCPLWLVSFEAYYVATQNPEGQNRQTDERKIIYISWEQVTIDQSYRPTVYRFWSVAEGYNRVQDVAGGCRVQEGAE